MNFKQNFEPRKITPPIVEKKPTIKHEFHYVINDIAKKVIDNQELTRKETDGLEMVYGEMQNLEKELMIVLDHYRSKGVISTPEFLVTINYFLTAKQNGPDSEIAKKILTGTSIPTENFVKILEGISIPEHTRKVLVNCYQKIFDNTYKAS